MWGATAIASLVLVSCAPANPMPKAARSQTTVIPTTTSFPTSTTTTTVPAQPGWVPLSRGPNGVIADQRNVTVPDGRQIVVVRFRAGQFRFNLHIGTQDPPIGANVLGPNSLSYVSSTERPLLVGAFNGGFKVNAGAGGTEVQGKTLTPLVSGDASLVIDANGTGRIGVWGSTVPVPGEQVVSVRQNLGPLISNGQISPQIGNIGFWGDPLHGLATTSRSALGEDLKGDFLYAGAMAALPSDLATALASDGAVAAMEMDINPEWIQCDLAPVAGAALSALIPGQTRPPSQYLGGWTRDFLTVLAPPGVVG